MPADADSRSQPGARRGVERVCSHHRVLRERQSRKTRHQTPSFDTAKSIGNHITGPGPRSLLLCQSRTAIPSCWGALKSGRGKLARSVAWLLTRCVYSPNLPFSTTAPSPTPQQHTRPTSDLNSPPSRSTVVVIPRDTRHVGQIREGDCRADDHRHGRGRVQGEGRLPARGRRGHHQRRRSQWIPRSTCRARSRVQVL